MYKANVNLFSLYLFCKNLIDQNRKNKLFKLVKNSKKQETAVCALYKVLIVTEIDIKIMKNHETDYDNENDLHTYGKKLINIILY